MYIRENAEKDGRTCKSGQELWHIDLAFSMPQAYREYGGFSEIMSVK